LEQKQRELTILLQNEKKCEMQSFQKKWRAFGGVTGIWRVLEMLVTLFFENCASYTSFILRIFF